MNFKLHTDYQPTGDQPQAITQLSKNLEQGMNEQVLLGVTGSGKTFTMANVIANVQKPTLILSHNKTLAAQLYQEFKSFFPDNAVSYFVSYYDFYQPEAYIVQTDTYIEKETQINEEIDKLRLAATTNLLTRNDTIIVASVSCIYNLGSPKEYGNFIVEIEVGKLYKRQELLARLVALQYERSEFDFKRGTFRLRGDTIDIYPAYWDDALRLTFVGETLNKLVTLDPLTGISKEEHTHIVLYPAKHYMTDPSRYKDVFVKIEKDLLEQVEAFKAKGKIVEAQRLSQKVRYDLEMIQAVGFVNGIENYSRYFDGRAPGDPPFTLFDYYKEKYGSDWLLFVDESHMTVPQVRGMYHGDRSRKENLINYGFRLPSALDNRPMNFTEFLHRIPQTVYVSATPDEWEIGRSAESAHRIDTSTGVVEQLVRPTGLIDPVIEVRPIEGQIADLITEIEKRVEKKERVLVTTLTKRTAEDLSTYLEERKIKVNYLHSDVETLVRSEILADLRRGMYDVIVGINLLREGLDLPEVSLVAILDADKEGFLRSRVALIQTMGRAARHLEGKVIMYADSITRSMRAAIDEVERRRSIQIAYNAKHHITPVSIHKPIRDRLVEELIVKEVDGFTMSKKQEDSLTPKDKEKVIKKLELLMRQAVKDLNFELAAQIRDKIIELKK